MAYIFADAYASYRKQILKINLFDEYCYLRSQELVKQNEYVLDHPSNWSLIKVWNKPYGGVKISEKLWEKSTGRPTITQPQITKTVSSFCKISSTDTWIQTLLRLWPTTSASPDVSLIDSIYFLLFMFNRKNWWITNRKSKSNSFDTHQCVRIDVFVSRSIQPYRWTDFSFYYAAFLSQFQSCLQLRVKHKYGTSSRSILKLKLADPKYLLFCLNST